MRFGKLPNICFYLMLAGSPGVLEAEAGCLENAPKPSSSLFEKCSSFGAFGANRGAYSHMPYEKADDGIEKEHSPPRGPRTFLLDFTKKNTGRLFELMQRELPEVCAYYYEGLRYNLRDHREKLALHFRKRKAGAFEKELLAQVFENENKLSVGDLVRLSKEFSDKAIKLGDEIFKDQLIPHAGSLEPSYQKEYLGKLNATLASLKGEPKEYVASDCDYLNAPINHLYGLIHLSRLTAAMAKDSCPEDYQKLDLESRQVGMRRKIEGDWRTAVRKAVLGNRSSEEAPVRDEAGSSGGGEEGTGSAE